MHLHRMTIDCRSMANKIKSLNKKINDLMKLKFGNKIDLDDLEESILRRLVQELRVAMLNIREVYEKQLSSWSDTYGEKQVELKNIIRENTARLDILAALNQEKASLAHLLSLQSKKIEQIDRGETRPDTYFTKDIDKLKKIVANQNNEIQALKAEIRSLTIKSLPPEPIEQAQGDIVTAKPLKKQDSDQEQENELSVIDSLDELYVAPSKFIMKDTTTDDRKATDTEIRQTMSDIIDETIDHRMSSNESYVRKLSLIITDLIEQLPNECLSKEDGVQMISSKLKKLESLKSVDVNAVVEQVTEMTGPTESSVHLLIHEVLQKSFDYYIYVPKADDEESF